jgi:hypothetical protein
MLRSGARSEMKDRIDRFRARAKECQQLAGMAPKADDRTFWLRLAEEWLRLAQVIDGFRLAEVVRKEKEAGDEPVSDLEHPQQGTPERRNAIA